MATETNVLNKKKRALEALERRFAAAKAETQHQQISTKRICGEQVRHSKLPVGPSLKASSASIHSNAVKKDLEVENLTYLRISQPVHDNLLSAIEIPNKEKDTVDKILHELLQKGDSGQKYVQGLKTVKFDNWILLDNFVQGHNTSAAQMRALRGNSKRSRRHMSLKQLKKLGLLSLPEELRQKNQVTACLFGADLHGAILQVVECKVHSLVGIVGIMIRETLETFGIITQENIFQVVPKRNSVFMLRADCWKITLHGDKYTSRVFGS